jgi:haloalkane dehalogenase
MMPAPLAGQQRRQDEHAGIGCFHEGKRGQRMGPPAEAAHHMPKAPHGLEGCIEGGTAYGVIDAVETAPARPAQHIMAPDLIGMGQSGKSPRNKYRFFDHAAYLDEWFDKLGLTRNLVLVVHDWGAALGFDRSFRYPESVAGIVYMEAMVRPRLWTDMPAERQAIFQRLRGPEGEQLVLRDNFFIEKMLFEYGVIRTLTDQEKAAYRAPFPTPESRLPTLVFPRDIPFDGEPGDMYTRVKQYSDWMGASTHLPKLFINALQGHGTAGDARAYCRRWPNQIEITVEAKHYVPEDCPHEIGAALVAFLGRLRRRA